MKLMNKMTIMTNNIHIKSTITSNIYYCLYTKLPKPFKNFILIDYTLINFFQGNWLGLEAEMVPLLNLVSLDVELPHLGMTNLL